MEKIKQELPAKISEGKIESKEKPLGDFSALLAGVGAKHRETYQKGASDEKEKCLLMIRVGSMSGEMEKSGEEQSRGYLDNLVSNEFGFSGRGGQLHGIKLNESELSDTTAIVEELAYQSSILNKWSSSSRTIPEIVATKNLGTLPTLKKLLEAGFVMDDIFAGDIKYLAEATEGEKRVQRGLYETTARVMKDYEKLTRPENINIAYGVARSLSIETPIAISTALELLKCADIIEAWRNETLGNEELTQEKFSATMKKLAESQADLTIEPPIKGSDYTAQAIERATENQFDTRQIKIGITNLAILSLLTKNGRPELAPLYEEISAFTMGDDSPKRDYLLSHLSVADNEMLSDKYEQLFWKMWNEQSYRRSTLAGGLITPRTTIEKMIDQDSPSPLRFLYLCYEFPDFLKLITNDTNRAFYEIAVGAAARHGGGKDEIAGSNEISIEAKRALVEIVAKHGGLQNMQNLPVTQMIKISAEAPLEIRTFLLKGIAKLNYSADDTDYSRKETIDQPGGRSREAGAEAEENDGSDRLTSGLNKLGLSANDRRIILQQRDLIHTILTRPIEATEQISEAEGLSKNEYESLSNLCFESKSLSAGLDESAHQFEIYNRALDKSRKIPGFTLLWSKKVEDYFESQILERLANAEPERVHDIVGTVLVDCATLYRDGLNLYRNESEEIIPHLNTMNEFVNKKLFSDGIWFSGRDGVPLRLAIKARYFGVELGPKSCYKNALQNSALQNPAKIKQLIELAQKERESKDIARGSDALALIDEGMELYLRTDAHINDLVKMAQISTLLLNNLTTQEQQDAFRQYFSGLEIHRDMLAVDTGYRGSVIKGAIKMVYGDLKPKDYTNIALLSSTTIAKQGGARIITDERESRSAAKAVEELPKKNDRYFIMDEETDKPIALPFNEDVRLLSWVAEHCIMRHLAPRPQKSRERMRLSTEYIVEDQLNMDTAWQSSAEMESAKEKIMELYDVATEKIAPAFVSFADYLLTKVAALGDAHTKVLFLAPDTLATYQSAQILLEKFPEKYPGISVNDLVYAYVSRRVIANNEKHEIAAHLSNAGLAPGDNTIIADMGMHEAVIEPLKDILGFAGARVESVEFLISRNPAISGHLDSASKPLKSLEEIPGNPVAHFLENTFSGAKKSPRKLFYDEDLEQWIPENDDKPYLPIEITKKAIALKAVRDHALSITKKSLAAGIDREALDQLFLSQGEHLKSLGVPHER